MPILRASEHNAAIQGVAFNFEDLTSRANAYLEQVRAQATKILTDAKREAAALQKKAEEEARAKGLAAAKREADQAVQKQVGQQVATLLPALKQVVDDLQQSKLAWLKHWENSAVHLATAIAERVIRHEVAQRPEIPLTLVREALELAAGSPKVRIHLHPADCAGLGTHVQTLAKELAGMAPMELVPDPEVEQGSCRVDTEYGVIDQRFSAQLARVEEELT